MACQHVLTRFPWFERPVVIQAPSPLFDKLSLDGVIFYLEKIKHLHGEFGFTFVGQNNWQ